MLTIPTAATVMDQPLAEDTIFTLPVPTQDLIQTLDIAISHQLATVMEPHLPNHSWQAVTPLYQTKLKSSTKQLKTNTEFEIVDWHK